MFSDMFSDKSPAGLKEEQKQKLSLLYKCIGPSQKLALSSLEYLHTGLIEEYHLSNSVSYLLKPL